MSVYERSESAKFIIPYDDSPEYETFGFILKEDIRDSTSIESQYIWQEVDENFKSKLIEGHLASLTKYRGDQKTMELVKEFLKDYPQNSIKKENAS